MKNKHKLTSTIFFFLSLQIKAQTFVGATLGYDLSNIHEQPVDWPGLPSAYFFQVEDGYSAKSLSYGLRIDQILSKRWGVSLQGNYTHKRVTAIDNWGFIQFRDLDFNYYRSSLTVNYTIFDHLVIGFGPTYHWIKNIGKVTAYGNYKSPFMDDKKEYGGTVRLGFKYWNGLLECYYNKGYKITGAETQRNDGAKLNSIDSVGISVSYMFQVFSWKKGKKGKGVYCPRF